MSSKKNAFFSFMSCYRESLIQKGQQPPGYQELSQILSPMWREMPENEKNKYKDYADHFNSDILKQKKNETTKHVLSLAPSQVNLSVPEITSTILHSISNKDELLDKKLIILHVHSHVHMAEKYYFPAEISAIEFNLRCGILRRHHTIIGISNIYPKGYAGAMREYSEKFHHIACWKKFPDDYVKIVSDFIDFLKVGIEDHDDSLLNLPDLFTVEKDHCQNLMEVQSSMNRLYATAFPDDHSESVFKIKSLEQLFNEIRTKLNVHLNPKIFNETVSDILQNSLYGRGLACAHHELLEIPFKCSTSQALQWMSNICSHLHDLDSIELIPGKHIPFNLRDGSRLFIEGDEPFPLSALILKDQINSLEDDDDDYELSGMLYRTEIEESYKRVLDDEDKW